MTKSNRIFYLDVLRVIACLSIIMIHTSAHYVVKDIGSFNFWIGDIFDSLARIGVPLFLMISGTIMLDKDYQFSSKKLIKHIVRLILFFIFWSIIYFLIYSVVGKILIRHESIDTIEVVSTLIKGNYHLWFIYLIIGLYLIVPLLRLWVNNDNKKYVEYFIILSLIFAFLIPQIISIGSNYSSFFKNLNDIIENNLQLKYVGGCTTYFILGWYINNYDFKHKKLIYLFGIIGLLVSIIGTYILSITTGKELQMYGNLSIHVLVQSMAIFMFIKNKYKYTQKENNKIISSIAKYSLGIYAIHDLFITTAYGIIEKINFDFALINILFIFTIVFLLSYLSSFILSKIPILKRVV